MTRFYGYRDKVVFPTVVQAEEGFYIDVDPITICDITDIVWLRELLMSSLEKGNPIVPTPERSEEHSPGSPLLEKLKLKKWLRFEAEASMYSVYVNEDRFEYYCSGNAVDGQWRPNQIRHTTFEGNIGLDALIDHIVIDINADMSGRQVGSTKLPSLLLPPPKPSES